MDHETDNSTGTMDDVKKPIKSKVVTGYILYSREVRKRVVEQNPSSSFGEISRIVGNEWRALPGAVKQSWEEKAQRYNVDAKAAFLEEQANLAQNATNSNDVIGYDCMWAGCDQQYEDIDDLVEHCIVEDTGHVARHFAQHPNVELRCYWKGCNRKKNSLPFPTMTRLYRHVREMHIAKSQGRLVAGDSRGRHFVASKASSNAAQLSLNASAASSASQSLHTIVQNGIGGGSGGGAMPKLHHNGTTAALMGHHVSGGSGVPSQHFPVPQAASQLPQKPLEPMFITVPPKPQRALHSEAYIRYIEGLHAEKKFISPWERTLTVTRETAPPPPDPDKLNTVAAWLGPRATNDDRGNVVTALWELRNHLLANSLGLHKAL